jgi:very-short-patch-repair endonuclease
MRTSIPTSLGPRFSVADARDLGVTAGRLRRTDLASPYRGIRTRHPSSDQADAADVHIRLAQDYAPIMGDEQFFSHVTAALLWGLPVPASVVASASRPDVGVLAPRRTPRSVGVIGRRHPATAVSVREHPDHRLRLLSPASTWASLATVLTDVRDLVAVGDAVVREPMFRGDLPPLATIAQLKAVVAAHRRVGVARLRAALPLIRTRSASRPETWLRLALLDAGLPEPELNWTVIVDGAFLACVDLAYPARRVALEYEGAHHAVEAAQWSRDIERHERLAAAGWTVLRITKQHLFVDLDETIRRVTAALAR